MVEVGQPYDDEPELQLVGSREHHPAQLKGLCPVCGVNVTLRNGTGRLWHHGPMHLSRQCKGSGGFPEPGSVRERCLRR